MSGTRGLSAFQVNAANFLPSTGPGQVIRLLFECSITTREGRRVKIISIFILPLLILPISDALAVNIENAIQDMCKCGFPPSSSCMNQMASKYPEIDQNPRLQDEVMRGYQDRCGPGAMFKDGSMGGVTGMPPAPSMRGAVGTTHDCSTTAFRVDIPGGWQCRKMGKNAQDVTLFAYGNRLNVTLGRNQGQTSCSVIPICSSEPHELEGGFETTRFTNPMVGSVEYAGYFKQDETIRLTITANTKPNAKQLDEIKSILKSVRR